MKSANFSTLQMDGKGSVEKELVVNIPQRLVHRGSTIYPQTSQLRYFDTVLDRLDIFPVLAV